MGRQRSIENHPQRAEIEAAVAAGESQRSVATRFGVSRPALQRHLSEIAKNPVAPAPESDPEPQSGVQAPPEAPHEPPRDDAAGPAAPENNARGGGSAAGAGVADPTASRFQGRTDDRGGPFATRRRVVEYANGVGDPTPIMEVLEPGRWADDVLQIGRAVLEEYARRHGLTDGALAGHLPHVGRPMHNNPMARASADLDAAAGAVMASVDLSAPFWSLLFDELRAMEWLQNAIAAAEHEAAERQRAADEQAIRLRPGQLRHQDSLLNSREVDAERAIERLEAETARKREELAGIRNRRAALQPQIEEATTAAAKLPPLVDAEPAPAAEPPESEDFTTRQANAPGGQRPKHRHRVVAVPRPDASVSVADAARLIDGRRPLPIRSGADGRPMGP